MSIAATAGQNVANNASGLSLADIVGNAARSTLGGITNGTALALPAAAVGAGYNFVNGMMNGAPAAAPVTHVAVVPAQMAPAVSPDRGKAGYDAAGTAVDAFMAKHPGLASMTPAQQVAAMGPQDLTLAAQEAAGRASAALPAAGATPTGVGDVLSRFAAGNGGNVDMNQLTKLSDAYARTLKATPKVETNADKVMGVANEAVQNQFELAMKQAGLETDPVKRAPLEAAAHKDFVANLIALNRGGSQINTNAGEAMNTPAQ